MPNPVLDKTRHHLTRALETAAAEIPEGIDRNLLVSVIKTALDHAVSLAEDDEDEAKRFLCEQRGSLPELDLEY